MKKYSRKKLARAMIELLERYPRADVAQAVARELVEGRLVRELPFFMRDSASALFEKTGELTAKVSSARVLSEATRTHIGQLLKKMTGASSVWLQPTKVDPGLLGGVQIETPILEIDASVKAKLSALENYG